MIVCHSALLLSLGNCLSHLTQGPCRMYCVHVLYTTGITMYCIYTCTFNTVPQIVEEQHCFQTLWKSKEVIVEISCQFKLSSKITLKALFCSRACRSLNCHLYKNRLMHCPAFIVAVHLHCSTRGAVLLVA